MADLDDIINTLIAEANGEGPEGMRRVGETILNRAAIRGISPAEVVRQPHQYTGYYAPGPLAVRAQQDPRVVTAAEAAWELARRPGDPTNGADHYFNPHVVNPGWQDRMVPTGDYGDHSFYRSRQVPAEALAALLTPEMRDVALPRSRPVFRDVDLPRARPASPTDTIAQMFGDSFSAKQDQATARGLSEYLAKQQAPSRGNLTLPGAIDQSVNSLSSDKSLAAALSRILAPRTAPAMPIGVAQSYAGQERIKRPSVQTVADAFSGDTRVKAEGPVLATIQTGPNIGKPPATRVVQSVPVSTKPAQPKPSTTQTRADNGQTQTRPASTAKATPTAAPAKTTSSRMDGVGQAPAFSDLAMMFGNVPQASNSVNTKKDNARLHPDSTWTLPEAERLALHGLTPPAPVKVAQANKPVELPRRRPSTPQQTKVAVTQPKRVAPVPAAATLRPQVATSLSVNRPTPAVQVTAKPQPAPVQTAKPAAQAPLKIVVQGANVISPNAGGNSGSWAPAGYTNDGTGRITSNETGGIYYERHLR